ncbi:MAG: glycosyltransferase family 4 protein [Anaerolineae bacterium]
MNVTFCLPDGPTLGGVTTWTAEMCRQLAAENRPVSLIEHITYNPKLPLHLPSTVNKIDCADGQHADSPFIKDSDVSVWSGRYQSQRPSTIVPNWSIGTYAACAQITMSDPDSLRIIGYAHTDENLYYDWLTYYEPIISCFVCVSDEIATKLIMKLPHRAADIVIKPYAVQVTTQLDREYSKQPEPLKLIYAGRISQRQKRIFDLIPLIEELVHKQVDFQLQVIGNGDEYEPFAKRLSALSDEAQQRVTLEPGLLPNQMADTWRAADLFLSVSEYEGTSIAMLEAMAQGCVPVVTQVSGTKAVITDGENGFAVRQGDMVKMGAIIQQLATDRERVAKVGTAAHQTILNRYRYEDYIEWFLKTADSLWQQPSRAWPAIKPIIPPKLSAIKRADLSGALSGDPAAVRILQHKLLHATRMAGPYYFMRDVAQRIVGQSPNG